MKRVRSGGGLAVRLSRVDAHADLSVGRRFHLHWYDLVRSGDDLVAAVLPRDLVQV